MVKFAVAHVDILDGNLKVEIISASNWSEAIKMHSGLSGDLEFLEGLLEEGLSKEEVFEELLNSEILVQVVEI